MNPARFDRVLGDVTAALPSKGQHGSGHWHVVRIGDSGCCLRDCGDLRWNGEVIGPDSTYLSRTAAYQLVTALRQADPGGHYHMVTTP